MQEAALFFSEHGFSASTRDLADRLGVRQALLYKYFSSKEALIDVVFKEAFSDQWAAQWSGVMANGKASLAERLNEFYAHYTEDPDSLRLRLFLRGALDGWQMPDRLTPLLDKSLVLPLVNELRREAGLPDLGARPLMAGERELAMLLHGSLVFHLIRDKIYKGRVVQDRGVVASLYIEVFLRGVRDSLKALHDGKLAADLSAREG